MNELVIALALIGQLSVTAYRSIPSQTDESPYVTSIGERVNEHGVAVSQDLLKAGTLRYGDVIYIEDVGFKVVNDTMHIRNRQHVDVWVPNYDQERAFHRKFKSRTLKIWRVRKNDGTKDTNYTIKKKLRK